MKFIPIIITGLLSLGLTACASHDRLYFVEKTHFGLRAELEPESQTPGNVNFGYKRSLATLIPCRSIVMKTDSDGDESPYCGQQGDPSSPADNNILSVISSFATRVTWFQGTRIQTFFATGAAASNTAANADAIKALATFPKQITQ